MSKVISQHALDRVLAYIRGHGVELTPEVCQQALRLVDRALDEASDEQILATALDLIPEFVDLGTPAFPVHQPPLARGSIGYH